MARITVEDCLKKVPSRYMLVNMVARRVRQIREGSEYLVNSPKNEDIVVSLREIAAGKISVHLDDPSDPAAIPLAESQSAPPLTDAVESDDVDAVAEADQPTAAAEAAEVDVAPEAEESIDAAAESAEVEVAPETEAEEPIEVAADAGEASEPEPVAEAEAPVAEMDKDPAA